MRVRGVLLAGGTGTRLGCLTRVTNKHLLPVAHQPMIYYPLYKFAGVGVCDVMVVTGPEHAGAFMSLLGSGREFGLSLTYRVQDEAGGIAQALGLAEEFCKDSRSVVLLGDNIFYDPLDELLGRARRFSDDATLVLAAVKDPTGFGVAEFEAGEMARIVEKPANTDSRWAVTGIYSYPPDVYDVIRTLHPSKRGELEITDVNNYYLRSKRLGYLLAQGFWTDAGTTASLRNAAEQVAERGVAYSAGPCRPRCAAQAVLSLETK